MKQAWYSTEDKPFDTAFVPDDYKDYQRPFIGFPPNDSFILPKFDWKNKTWIDLNAPVSDGIDQRINDLEEVTLAFSEILLGGNENESSSEDMG